MINVQLYSNDGKADYGIALNGVTIGRSRDQSSVGDATANGQLFYKLAVSDTVQVNMLNVLRVSPCMDSHLHLPPTFISPLCTQLKAMGQIGCFSTVGPN